MSFFIIFLCRITECRTVPLASRIRVHRLLLKLICSLCLLNFHPDWAGRKKHWFAICCDKKGNKEWAKHKYQHVCFFSPYYALHPPLSNLFMQLPLLLRMKVFFIAILMSGANGTGLVIQRKIPHTGDKAEGRCFEN